MGPPGPLFTLRGHKVGVTALVYCTIDEARYLVSGDEQGNIFIWDVTIFRKQISHSNILTSRVQSLRYITFKDVVSEKTRHILVAQSREDGVNLYDLVQMLKENPQVLVNYPTCGSLFSRGDSKMIDDHTALLAYPSIIEKNLVTVRVVDSAIRTKLSGTASRSETSGTIFDISLTSDQPHMIVAYEDGKLAIYQIDTSKTKRVPHLNVEGLAIPIFHVIDTRLTDFVSAFGVTESGDDLSIMIGSPLNEIICYSYSMKQCRGEETGRIALSKSGISSVAVRGDKKLFAIGCWDSRVKLYSLRTKKFLCNLRHHSKQVSDIIFLEKPECDDLIPSLSGEDQSKYYLCCASLDCNISFTCIY